MARKFATNLDLAGNELLNVIVQVLASAPGSPKAGQAYYDSTKKQFGYYNGTSWQYLSEGGVAEATSSTLGTVEVKNDLGGTGVSPTVVHFTLTSNASAGTNKITSLGEPTAGSDAATKAYVDGKLNGVSWKQPVQAASAADLGIAYTAAGTGESHTLTANSNGILEVDGVQITVLGKRILLKDAAEGKNNGIYELTTKGTAGAKYVLTRAPDAATEAELTQATVMAEEGTANADHIFTMTTNPAFTVDTTALTWVEMQSGLSVVGDSTYTTRSGNQIKVIPGEAAASEPGEGAVTEAAVGVARKATFAIRGNGTLEEFTITHNLKTRNLVVQGMESSSKLPTKPVELDWEVSGENKIVVKFPFKVGSSTMYHITIIG